MTLSGAMQQILSILSMGLSKKKTPKATLKKSKSTPSFQEPSPKIMNANVNALDKSKRKDSNSKFISSPQEPATKFIETKFDTHNNLSINETDASTETSPHHAYQYLKPYCYHTKNISVDKLHRL